jgi:hypothetical protein
MSSVVSPLPVFYQNSVEPLAGALRGEWSSLCSAHPNILLIGDAIATREALSDLQPTLQLPFFICRYGRVPLTLPPSESVRTLILHDVGPLSLGEQHMLNDWLSSERIQIVTTSTVPLFPLVTRGAFLETLYYRLNVIYVELTRSPSEDELFAEAISQR